ncbi:hypothetical protein KDW_22640 [Dictyobacter vulcani]|uniref:Helicase XPB/Ssl2 N-terminal domain-containing protein n=1 Tax=Dictyobacter vulcani TaxID=2607529 RepID=A0A5J4KLW6_9CHLR|nr:helicase-associated domain-containing protein [Dictyobacter vulcani]GER88102.1 hypothetical protein KDW_22640 [Dictyobacter vulcani]
MQEILEAAPEVIIPAEPVVLYDVATLINAIYQITIEPTKNSNVPKRIVKKLRPLLKGQPRLAYDDEDIYLDMLLYIMKTLKLFKYTQLPFENAKPYLAPSSYLSEWSQLDAVEQTRVLLEIWPFNYTWTEVNRFVADNYSWGYAYGSHTLKMRQVLLDHLAKRTPGQWYSLEYLLKEIWDANPSFAAHPLRPAYGRNGSRVTSQTYEQWLADNALIFLNMFFSTILELGIADFGHEPIKEEKLLPFKQTGFRLTELGQQALIKTRAKAKTKNPKEKEVVLEKAVEHKKADAPRKSLIVQPNYEIMLLEPDFPILYKLLPFTQIKQLQMVSTLLLTQSALLKGMESGPGIDEILKVLTEASHKELPQNITYTLRDWAKQYKRATVTQVILLELPNEEVTSSLSKNATLLKMDVSQIAPRILAIPFDSAGSVNYQSIRQVLQKENVTADFLVPESRSARYASYYD